MVSPEHEVTREAKYAIGAVYALIVGLGSFVATKVWLGTEGVHYLATRRNILNQLFVKRGWFWFTLLFWGSYVSRNIKHPIKPALLRYGAATLWWVLFTQWFFGAPLMDRTFTLTGGSCAVDIESQSNSLPVTSAKCRGSGGAWQGGHDPSGHVFILVHSSLVLWMEILPDLISSRRLGLPLNWGIKAPLILLSLWGFMLFLTSVYFHSVAEKFSGLLFAYFEVFLVYIKGEDKNWGQIFGVRARQPIPVKESTEPEQEVPPRTASI